MPHPRKTKGSGGLQGALRKRGPRQDRSRPGLRVRSLRGDDAELRSLRMDHARLRLPAAPSVSRLDPKTVMYHGSAGAFAHIASQKAFPDARSIACENLFEVIDAVRGGRAEAAVLPCENILAGRVPDIHMLLPDIGLTIVGEIFLPIELHLVAPHGWSLQDIKRVHSHPVALKQIQRFLAAHGLSPVEESNTATAAALIKQRGDRGAAAAASALAAETHGLTILTRNIEDIPFNMTRFYVLAAKPVMPAPEQRDIMTSLLFEVRNTPGALFRAVGGFADNGINLTRLESYLVDGQFVATRFLCEFEGHPDQTRVQRALAALKLQTTRQTILGVFPMHAIGSRVRARSGRTSRADTVHGNRS
ncbi:prephenate dehydratase domain-containing protein [Stappia sp. ES.058]|uniref:prephenate dehydratase domain-containing protein n=1 Tax=Stappia sp. ES.058 TaxID=1881061 RepID=UPI00087B00BE|nr:prephenate dehydratase domain-containing protein [Stappia sp. ES.058]SDU08090.1 prephenate dehydratase [Stappia sp. ES.058]